MARDPAHAAEQLVEATEMIERGDGEEILYRDSGTMRSAALCCRPRQKRVTGCLQSCLYGWMSRLEQFSAASCSTTRQLSSAF